MALTVKPPLKLPVPTEKSIRGQFEEKVIGIRIKMLGNRPEQMSARRKNKVRIVPKLLIFSEIADRD